MLKFSQEDNTLRPMREGILSTFRQQIHMHWGLVLVFGLLSVMCCCCMEFCGDEAEHHSSEQHEDHAYCHCHQTVVVDASSKAKDVSDGLRFGPAPQTLLAAFDLSDLPPSFGVPSTQLGAPTQTDLILRSFRLLI